MKKMMTAIAACAVASLSLAAGGVTSQNVVGYKGNVAVVGNNFTLMSAPFTPVGGGATPINNLFSDNTLFTAGYSLSEADSILVWTGSTYNYYYYSIDSGYTWTLDGYEPTTDKIPTGGAFWFHRITGSPLNSLTMAGEVVKTNISVTATGNAFTMVGNPFAASITIASITAPNLTAGYSLSEADSILVWNGSTYTYYYYSIDSGYTWTLDGYEPTTDTIPVGGAFWFNRYGGSSATLTLPVPYSL